MTIKAGQLIMDGNAVWIIDDVRDGARVGDIILRPTLRDGYIKANGATVKASEYPRLLAWAQKSNMAVTAEQYAQDCSKYVYDAARDKLTLPNAVGRVLHGGESVKSLDAGLPNITYRIDSAGFGYGKWNGNKLTHLIASEYTDGAIHLSKPLTTRLTWQAEPNGGALIKDVTFDASKSNPIYGASETVQPPAIALIAQIKY